jgi:hypothetical protein
MGHVSPAGAAILPAASEENQRIALSHSQTSPYREVRGGDPAAPPQAISDGRQAAKEFALQQFSINGSTQVPQNSVEETLAPAEARPAEQPAPALTFTPLAPKSRTPGLVVRTRLKAGTAKLDGGWN